MTKQLRQISTSIKPILKKAGVLKSSLFGSYARGQAGKKSDVDILVHLPASKDLFDFVNLKQALEKKLGKKVDLVTYRSLSPLIRDRVKQEQIKIL